jgi:hypothetical protein
MLPFRSVTGGTVCQKVERTYQSEQRNQCRKQARAHHPTYTHHFARSDRSPDLALAEEESFQSLGQEVRLTLATNELVAGMGQRGMNCQRPSYTL